MNLRSIRCIFIFLAGVTINHSCTKEYSCESCKGNRPPIANAGRDTTIVLPVDSMQLDGSASFDPDGSIVSYKWIKISGPASFSILQIDSAKTLTNGLAMGVYEFELTVKDNSGLSAKDTVQIIVNDPVINQPPVAKAGADQTITLPADSVVLDGSASFDPDGKIVSYKWIDISGPASYSIVQPDSSTTYVTNLVAGVYWFELTVTDDGRLNSKDSITINVNGLPNRAPVANAGPDQMIYLPTNSANLDGRASTDPDNNIISYLWTKISGPSSFNIATVNVAQTQVTNLAQGVYQFELKVTDAGGLFSKDTLQIIVQPIVQTNCDTANRSIKNASFTFIANVPVPRYGINITAVGNKIFMAGGHASFTASGSPSNFSNRVDIYDITTGKWTTTELPKAGIIGTSTVLGNKIFFAGGWNDNGIWPTINVYEVVANTWSTGQLSQLRMNMAGATINNRVLFAGGENIPSLFNTVDIYDVATNSWSTASLSMSRYMISTVTTVGQKIFFAGGQNCWIMDCPTNRIDVYDASTNTWAHEDYTPHVSGNVLFSGIAAGNKNFWVTGDYWEGGNIVEIRDEILHATTCECLTGVLFGWMGAHPIRNANKLIFPVSALPASSSNYRLTHFDVYDLATNTWSISRVPSPVNYNQQFISVNSEVYSLGSTSPAGLYGRLYKLNY